MTRIAPRGPGRIGTPRANQPSYLRANAIYVGFGMLLVVVVALIRIHP